MRTHSKVAKILGMTPSILEDVPPSVECLGPTNPPVLKPEPPTPRFQTRMTRFIFETMIRHIIYLSSYIPVSSIISIPK